MDLNNHIWFQKYRPQVLDDMVLESTMRNAFQEFVNAKCIPHLLLAGDAGTGKTSVAEILIRTIDPKNIATLRLNASSERGIGVVRDKITPFLAAKSLNPLKIVFLDECDYTTPEFQTALRNIMEVYSTKSRFILTCNFVNRIIDPIQSRCALFEFQKLPKKHMIKTLCGILEKEEIEYDLDAVIAIVDDYFPDIRKLINACQRFSQKMKFNYSIEMSKTHVLQQIGTLIKGGKYTELAALVSKQQLFWTDVYKGLFDDAAKYFPVQTLPQVRIEIWEALKADTTIPDQLINFLAFSIKAMRLCGISEGQIK